ncbi:MAG: leucine-rich repeat domain-containing protein [Clostridia bacterium]|nr:leucine-rich repeat domain-containing protein [Clostridia bacterium]
MDKKKLRKYLGIVAAITVLMAIIVAIFFLFDCKYTQADVSGFGQGAVGGDADAEQSYDDDDFDDAEYTDGGEGDDSYDENRGRFWPLEADGDVMTDAYGSVYTPVYGETDGDDGVEWGIMSYSFTAVAEGVEDLVIPGDVYGVPVSVADKLMGDVRDREDAITVLTSNTTLKSLTIEEGVTSIGKCAFAGCEALETVVMADTVTKIGDYAFSGDTAMESLTLSGSLEEIGMWAFYKCPFETLELPDSLVTMGKYSFNSCNGLTAVEIPSSVVTMNKGVFRSCKSLTSAVIRGNEKEGTSVGSHVFNGCSSLVCVTLAGHISYIGQYTFGSCSSFEYLIILDTVDKIDMFAFYLCNAFERVYFGGDEESWNKLLDKTYNTVNNHNTSFLESTVYYYSDEEPDVDGDFWHWDENYRPVAWADEATPDTEDIPA